MVWLILMALLVIILVSVNVRVRIKREYGREAVEDSANVRAYDRACWIPAFGVVRSSIIMRLKEGQVSGWLLDAGCGPGHLVRDISNKRDNIEVVGLDINRDMLDLARKRSSSIPPGRRPHLCQADVQSLPFRDGSLDVIVSTLSLHHWPDTDGAFAEFERVLKPGGRFLILDLKRDVPLGMYAFLWVAQALAPGPIRRGNAVMGSLEASYTAAELRALIARYRFREVSVVPHFGWFLAAGTK